MRDLGRREPDPVEADRPFEVPTELRAQGCALRRGHRMGAEEFVLAEPAEDHVDAGACGDGKRVSYGGGGSYVVCGSNRCSHTKKGCCAWASIHSRRARRFRARARCGRPPRRGRSSKPGRSPRAPGSGGGRSRSPPWRSRRPGTARRGSAGPGASRPCGVFDHPMGLHRRAGQDRGVRRIRRIRLAVGHLEEGALRGESVEIRRCPSRIAVGGEVIGAQGIDGDQEHGGRRERLARSTRERDAEQSPQRARSHADQGMPREHETQIATPSRY